MMELLVHRVEVRMEAWRSGCGRTGSSGWSARWRAVGGSVTPATVSADGETITVHIPMVFKKRGGRRLVVTPDGATWAPRPRVDNAMVKALARAFQVAEILDDGVHMVRWEDLARAKDVNAANVSRILRLTLLAPEIVEAILDGRQPAEMGLDDLSEGFPLEWEGQQSTFRR